MTAQIDLQALLPSERKALAGAARDLAKADEDYRELEPIIAARAACSDDDTIVLDFPEEGVTTARAMTRAAFRQMTERDAPPAEGRGVPILSVGLRQDTLMGFAHPAPVVAGRLVRAAEAAKAVLSQIAQEQLAFRMDQADQRAAERAPSPTPTVAAAAPSRRKRWEDLSVAEMVELRQKHEKVFDRLLEDYRRRVGATR